MLTSTIPIEVLHQLLEYNPINGSFVWKYREPPRGLGAQEKEKWFKQNISCNNRLAGTPAGVCLSKNGYPIIKLLRQTFFAHRIAWAMHYGEWPKGQIDHINHIRNDNRILNLRTVSVRENSKNRALPPNNKSGIIGVSWRSANSKWCAQIKINGVVKRLGYFARKEDAAMARKQAEIAQGYHPNHGKPLLAALVDETDGVLK